MKVAYFRILMALSVVAPVIAGDEAAMPVPKYLQNCPSELYVRDGEEIVKAPTQDVAVAQNYPKFQDKGKLRNGQRITIMTCKTEYRVGEEIRVVHVLEAPEEGHELYVMGPKAIQEEYVDGRLTSAVSADMSSYDGMVPKSPGVDFNYEISVHRFDKPGIYTIQWKGGGHPIQGDLGLVSNELRITVTK